MFEEELSKAHISGLEMLLMGDFNIDLKTRTNHKWRNQTNLFDLTQLVTEPIRITETTATLIDQVYTTHPQNIVQCFTSSISLSDHFLISFTRKISSKIPQNKHITTYENAFISDLTNDPNTFVAEKPSIDEDFSIWYSLILKHLNNHRPIKSKRMKQTNA